MYTAPASVGPMKYPSLPYGFAQTLGFNWTLCRNHWKAISKIDSVADNTFKTGLIWNKNFHRAMILFEALPIIGHIVCALEILSQRVNLAARFKDGEFKKWEQAFKQRLEEEVPPEKVEAAMPWINQLSAHNESWTTIQAELRAQAWFVNLAYISNYSAFLANPIIKEHRDFALFAVYSDAETYESIHKDLANDIEFQLDCIEVSTPYFFRDHLSSKFNSDYSKCLRAVARKPEVYEFLCEKFKRVEQMILTVFTNFAGRDENSEELRRNAHIYTILPDDVQRDIPLLRKIVSRNGLVLNYTALDGTHDDPDFVLTAVRNNYHAYGGTAKTLADQPGFFLKVFKANPRTIKYAPAAYLADKKFVIDFLSNTELHPSDYEILDYLDSSLKSDRDIALLQVRRLPEFLGEIHTSFRKDSEIVLTALSNTKNSDLLKYVDPSLFANEEVMKLMLALDGLYLEHIPGAKKELALIAVRENPEAYRFVSALLWNDLDIEKAYRKPRNIT